VPSHGGRATEAGFVVVGPAPSVGKAVKLIEEVGCDVAVLDVNLRDKTAEPVAREVRARRTPFLFLSAVSRDHLPPGSDDEVLLPKQAQPVVLVAALQTSITQSYRNWSIANVALAIKWQRPTSRSST
jgi:DNA-binding response OmpR family regulator